MGLRCAVLSSSVRQRAGRNDAPSILFIRSSLQAPSGVLIKRRICLDLGVLRVLARIGVGSDVGAGRIADGEGGGDWIRG